MKIDTNDLTPEENEILEESKMLTSMMSATLILRIKDKSPLDAMNIGALSLSNLLAHFSRSMIVNDKFGHQLQLIDDICKQSRKILRAIKEDMPETKQ
jgi:hypothetical protein